MEDENIRRKFEASLLRAASVPDPEIIYVRRADEIVHLTAPPSIFSNKRVFLPHPDVTLEEFFSTAS